MLQLCQFQRICLAATFLGCTLFVSELNAQGNFGGGGMGAGGGGLGSFLGGAGGGMGGGLNAGLGMSGGSGMSMSGTGSAGQIRNIRFPSQLAANGGTGATMIPPSPYFPASNPNAAAGGSRFTTGGGAGAGRTQGGIGATQNRGGAAGGGGTQRFGTTGGTAGGGNRGGAATANRGGTGNRTGATNRTMAGGAGAARTGAVNRSNPNAASSTSSSRAASPVRHQYRLAFETPAPTPNLVSQSLDSRFARTTGRVDLKNVNAATTGDEVTLRGVVNSEHSRRLAETMARMQPGVRTVVNDLSVVPTSPATPAAE